MYRRIVPATIAVALMAGSVASVARADDPPEKERRAFDAQTGRNLLNFPPHRIVDVRHTLLQLRIPSMNERTILATATVTIAPIASDVESFSLDAALLQVAGVTSPNRTCTFVRDDQNDKLNITLSPALAKGQTADVSISYRISDPPEGLMWTVESPAFPGRAAQIHSQGESEMNHSWFPCQDFPNARGTSEMIVTVPRGFQVVSNGKLASMVQEKLEPFDTFHWVQDKPHSAYLVDLVVGKWDVVDVGSSKLPMPVYVPPGQGDRVRAVFGQTPHMIDLISHLVGEPYPWAKYAQVSAMNFGWGGMENTSATTLYETVALDKTALLDGDQEDLTVHELAHQWFGDLLTCKSWEHIWLNEGFATYVESLWVQFKGASIPSNGSGAAGLSANNDAYLAMIWNWQQDVIKNDTGAAPFQPAMVSKEYDGPDDVFDRAANPYPKGALVLHMLRERMGDEVFFRGLGEYVQKHKFKQVETFQLRETMEKASGLTLQRFFDQWAYRPLVPKVKVSSSWDAAKGALNTTFEQTQTIDGYNPAFELAVPVWVRQKGRTDWTKLEAKFDTRTFALTSKLASEPEMVVVDPELAALAEFDVTATPESWAQTLASGPTMGSRMRAANALAHSATPGAAAALATAARDTRALKELRIECVQALGEMDSIGATELLKLLENHIPEAPVRSEVVSEVAHASEKADSAAREMVASKLARIFTSDPSYGVRAAAVKGLGQLKVESGLPTIMAALDTESQHDQIRKDAVGALAAMDRADSVPLVIRRVALGNSSSLRPDAIAALGKLAHHEPDRVFNVLAALLDDREIKTVQAAGKALSDIGGSRTQTLFEQRLAGLTSRFWKAQTRQWLREMKEEKTQAAMP